MFETLDIGDDVRELIGAKANSKTLMRAGIRDGMTTMFQHAVAKCHAGITSAAEVLRVTTAK